MFRFYDFQCTGVSCPEHFKMKELMVVEGEEPECHLCHKIMDREFPAPKGYVRGTHTPCKQ
jgi:hypothetical protein